jgi:hypothetical protein
VIHIGGVDDLDLADLLVPLSHTNPLADIR